MLIICQFGKLQPPADKKKSEISKKNRKIKELSLRVKRAEIKVARRRRIAFYNFRSSAGYILAFQRREARIYADNPAKRNPDLARVIAQLIGDESTLPDCCLHLKLKQYCNSEYCKIHSSRCFGSKGFLENTAVDISNVPNFENKHKPSSPSRFLTTRKRRKK